MKSILNNIGYGIKLDDIDKDELESLKEALTVAPKVMADYDFGQIEEFPVYRLSDKYIYLPKFYALRHYGEPSVNKEKDGQDVNFEFKGSLMNHQVEFCDTILSEIKEVRELMCLD